MSSAPSWRQGKTTAQRLYGARWQRARGDWLRAHPLCAMCETMGRLQLATIVDHKVPHRGNVALFWDQGNWQSLCKLCHDAHKQRLERSGTVIGCDANGIPLDASHHWR